MPLPYILHGYDSLEPFFKHKEKFISFGLTSNSVLKTEELTLKSKTLAEHVVNQW